MINARQLMVAAMLLAACKGKSDDKKGPADPPAPGTATGGSAASAGTAAPAPDGGTTAAAPDLRCETQCRFLANTPLAEVATFYQEACGKPWVPPADKDCEALDYQRNCIYATAGYVFKKDKWKDAFGKQNWYTARSDFKPTDLSRVAIANIRDLKELALECKGGDTVGGAIPSKFTASHISAADHKTVVEWFRKKAKGELVLPANLKADFQPATAEELKKDWFASPHLFTLEEWTPFEYNEGEGKAGAPRTVWVGTSAAGPDCVDEGGEECEGYEVIYFDLDAAGKIVGISVTAAACPVVFVVTDEGAVYQGEILRWLGQPSLERTERMTLEGIGAACPRQLHVRLAEVKDEITYLDDVALELDGHTLAPTACAGGAGPAYCGEDGRHVTLARGEALDLMFDIPAGASCAAPALRADGHYVPVPAP